MEYTRITLVYQPPVARFILNRPEVHNAFDEKLIAELTEAYRRIGSDPSVRAVVLAAEGKSFCAGADLSYMQRAAAYTREGNLEDARTIQQMLATIAECPKVTIARVQGAAIGGGVGLVAACDIAVAVDQAIFGLSEVRIGLVPAVISPYVLQKIGMGACRALFVTGERITASEAHRLGLIHKVVSAEELDNAIQSQIGLVLQSGPHAITAAKRLLQELQNKTVSESADITSQCIADLRAGQEGQEGIRAFIEKRKPDFAA